MKRPLHAITTAHLGVVNPFTFNSEAAWRGLYIGEDLLGGQFCFDPFEMCAGGFLTNPNMIVLGQLGRGKSALVKTYLWRQVALGRRAWVLDPKGEYSALAEAAGTRAIHLAPGGNVGINPLEAPPGSEVGPVSLLCSMAEVGLGRLIGPRERAAVEAAVEMAREGGRLHLRSVIDALLDPSPSSALRLATTPRRLADDGRDVALELLHIVGSEGGGLFEGPTSSELDLDQPIVVIDLSDLYGSPLLGTFMTCVLAWLSARIHTRSFPGTLIVVDEAWAVLAQLSVARWLQAAWKLARAWGVANLAVVHRPSDLTGAGGPSSPQAHLAGGLLADSETKVVYAQAPSEAELAGRLFGLSRTEVAALPRLARGVGLWKVGNRSFLVRHRIGRAEWALVDSVARPERAACR